MTGVRNQLVVVLEVNTHSFDGHGRAGDRMFLHSSIRLPLPPVTF